LIATFYRLNIIIIGVDIPQWHHHQHLTPCIVNITQTTLSLTYRVNKSSNNSQLFSTDKFLIEDKQRHTN